VTFLRGRAELGVAAFLALVGVVVLVDGLGLPTVSAAADPVGTRPMPLVVGAMLVVCAVFLALDVVRGGRGEVEGGEDVDLDHPSDWRTVGLLLVAFLANIVLIDRLGFVISGAILFWGSCFALGSRHLVRDPLISVALSLVTFYGFYSGLGIRLPAGILQGVL
jgi:putative tricarboxylic transport membrane protein